MNPPFAGTYAARFGKADVQRAADAATSGGTSSSSPVVSDERFDW